MPLVNALASVGADLRSARAPGWSSAKNSPVLRKNGRICGKVSIAVCMPLRAEADRLLEEGPRHVGEGGDREVEVRPQLRLDRLRPERR